MVGQCRLDQSRTDQLVKDLDQRFNREPGNSADHVERKFAPSDRSGGENSCRFRAESREKQADRQPHSVWYVELSDNHVGSESAVTFEQLSFRREVIEDLFHEK